MHPRFDVRGMCQRDSCESKPSRDTGQPSVFHSVLSLPKVTDEARRGAAPTLALATDGTFFSSDQRRIPALEHLLNRDHRDTSDAEFRADELLFLTWNTGEANLEKA